MGLLDNAVHGKERGRRVQSNNGQGLSSSVEKEEEKEEEDEEEDGEKVEEKEREEEQKEDEKEERVKNVHPDQQHEARPLSGQLWGKGKR